MNPLAYGAGSYIVYGNLRFAISTGSPTAVSTIALNGGKWYFEVTATSLTGAGPAYIGVYSAAGVSFAYQSDGNKYSTASGVQAYGASYTTGDVIGVAYDDTAGTLTFYKNNTSQGVAFSSMATNQSYCFSIASGSATARNFDANFGQRPFSYTPPTGFVALNTQNLPSATIKAGNKYFDATTWTGNGTSQSITNAGAFQPDFVWIKSRSGAYNNYNYDSVRGVLKEIYSNLTNAEYSNTVGLSAFNSNGFSVNSGDNGWNANAVTYVGWQWKAGGTAVSNTAGTITSQVSANPTAGFSVVGYTGTGANATVGHGLGVAPSMIITKVRSTAGADWAVYHASIGNTKCLFLDTTATPSTSVNFWNNTSPTSTVFSVGISGSTNNSGNTMIAYCWAPVAGYSAFGSYTGNGSADGPFVYLGFIPKYILIKASSGTNAASQGWEVRDSTREPYNDANRTVLFPNTSSAEIVDAFPIDMLSNGFKVRNTGNGTNESGTTYIYAAFAENPFKNSLAR